MSRNGSGTYSVPNAFVAGTTITASAHNANWDDIKAEITNSVAADGQTPMSAPLKLANGTESAPAIAFNTDTDNGLYRIGANNIGFSVGGAKVLDLATTGLAVTGTLSSTGALTVSGAFTVAGQGQAANGTVSLPAYSFTDDTDSGLYRIGANNLGLAVNGAKVLDVSTTGLNVVGTVSSNGTALSPFAQGVMMVNGTIVESHAGNAVTFAIKTLAGADPSSTDPVLFGFRNVSAASGSYSVVQATAALSLTITSGSTMGFTNGVPARLWLAMFDDGGVLRLSAIKCSNSTTIYPLGSFGIASATAEGGAGAADSALVFYANAAISSKAYSVIGYASYEVALATAGAWDAAPTRIQLSGYGVKLPGDSVQRIFNTTTTQGTVTNTVLAAFTNGQSQSITLTSAANAVRVWSSGIGYCGTNSAVWAVQHVRGTTPIGVLFAAGQIGAGGSYSTPAVMETLDFPNTTSATTYTIYGKQSSGELAYPGTNGTYTVGAMLTLEEIVA